MNKYEVMDLIHDTEMLECICQDADMGRAAVGHVINLTQDTQLRDVLKQQRSDYQRSYAAAAAHLQKKGDAPPSAKLLTKAMAYIGSDFQTFIDHSASKIAELVIQGNTMGITEITKQLNQYDGSNRAITDLAHEQIKMEQKNIDNLKAFL